MRWVFVSHINEPTGWRVMRTHAADFLRREQPVIMKKLPAFLAVENAPEPSPSAKVRLNSTSVTGKIELEKITA